MTFSPKAILQPNPRYEGVRPVYAFQTYIYKPTAAPPVGFA